MTRSPQRPLVSRCVYSISVAADGEAGITSPPQVGQWLPQPSPECVMRTQAPNRMTPSR